MFTSQIQLTVPFCDPRQEKQTPCSLVSRITAVGIGALALLIGILILLETPYLSALGTLGGGLFCGIGGMLVLAGAFLRRKVSNQAHPEQIQRTDTELSNNTQVNFAQITPANFAQYLDVSLIHDMHTAKKGDFTFKQYIEEKDGVLEGYTYKKGEPRLAGTVQCEEKGCFTGASLQVCGDKFIHFSTWSYVPPEQFSNLKDFFDYLFRGNFHQGECTKNMDFFALKTANGRELRYYNPYKKKS